jgi:hypothetical protein
MSLEPDRRRLQFQAWKLKAHQREAELRNDLRTEREERLKIEREVDDFVARLTRGKIWDPRPKLDHSSLMTCLL